MIDHAEGCPVVTGAACTCVRPPRPSPKPPAGDGFPHYCNTCGRENGTHSHHCNNDR